jgi:hypothetical protein
LNRRYLGDGVFVRWEPRRVVLTAEDGMRETNIIFLEPEVLKAFLEYLKEMKLA